MLSYYKNSGGKVCKIKDFEENCWVNAVNPTEREMFSLSAGSGISQDFLHAALDVEEMPRIECVTGQTLIICHVPVAETRINAVSYVTLPMAIILSDRCTVTVSPSENTILSEFAQAPARKAQTGAQTKFVLDILMRMSARFLQYLRQIDRVTKHIERQLSGRIGKNEILQLFGLRKSLIYFTTSLKANEITLEKILRGRVVKLTNEDEELLEDVLIEIKQASEMSSVYGGILSATMDALNPIIESGRGSSAKFYATVAVVALVPSAVFGFYSMNISGMPLNFVWFPLLLSAALVFAVLALAVGKKS